MFQFTNPENLDDQMEHRRVQNAGIVYSYTLVQEVPEGYEEQSPYVLALVKLDDGQIVTAQLTDLDGPVAIGDRVEMITRKITTDGRKGMIVYGYKFRPAMHA